jgi:hypothetical protein
MKVTQKQAKTLSKKLGIILSPHGLTLPIWTFAINVELEHSSLLTELGIEKESDKNLFAGKIAIAHLREYPDYYQRLKEMEKSAEKYWKGKDTPKIFK